MKRHLALLIMLGLIGCVAIPAMAESRSRKRAAANNREATAQQAYQNALAQLAQRFDLNKNGRLDPEERKALMAAVDTNLDGRLSPEEVMNAVRGGGDKEKERPKDGAAKKKKNKEE